MSICYSLFAIFVLWAQFHVSISSAAQSVIKSCNILCNGLEKISTVISAKELISTLCSGLRCRSTRAWVECRRNLGSPKAQPACVFRPASRLSAIGIESSHLPNESAVSSPSPPLEERAGERSSFNAAPANSTAVRPSEGATESRVTHYSRVYISAGIHGDEPAGPLAIRNY